VSYREMAESVGVSKIRTGSCELARATQTGWSHEEKFDGDFLLHGTPSLDCGRKTRAVGFKHTLNPVPSPLLRAKIPLRKGRIRSAERTEVHLVMTTSCYELTFCPLNADLGRRKGSSPCQSEPYRPSRTLTTSNTKQKTYSGIMASATWERRSGYENFTRASLARPMPKSSMHACASAMRNSPLPASPGFRVGRG